MVWCHSGFFKASFRSAKSNMILNGRPTAAFQLARSVRQGCPLSPLIFILGLDTLSLMLTQAKIQRTLVGVDFRDLLLSTLHSMYVDDTSVIIKAEIWYVMALKAILDLFSIASGLRFIWENTKAAFIPGGPPPMSFWLFP